MKTLEYINTGVISLLLVLQSSPVFAASSRFQRYYDDTDYGTNSASAIGPAILFMIGFAISAILLIHLISKIFPSYSHPVWTSIVIAAIIAIALPKGNGIFVISLIGGIGIFLWVFNMFPGLIMIWLVGFSFFSGIFFLGELFTSCRLEYLLKSSVLPVISFSVFAFKKAKSNSSPRKDTSRQQ